MDTVIWRNQLLHARQNIINRIIETLRKYPPFSGPEGTNELMRIASLFEHKVFTLSVDQTDYLRKISAKMLTLEIGWRNAANSNSLPFDPCSHLMDNDFSYPVLTNEEPAMNTGNLMDNNNRRPSLPNEQRTTEISDWRIQLPHDSRQKIVDKIMETLKKQLPCSGTNELMRIASLFEGKVFGCAVNQTDYLRKISAKMLTLISQNAANTNRLPFDPFSHLMDNDYSYPVLTNEEPAVNTVPTNQGHLLQGSLMDDNNLRPSPPNEQPTMETCDWRTQLLPDSRQKIISKIMGTLKKHLPFSGPEGINQLRMIASRFEQKIFNAAVNQTDYLRKISTKMLSIETRSQKVVGSSSSSISAGGLVDNINNPKPSSVKEEANTDDWRTQLPPESRQSIVNKLAKTLKNNVPHSGQEGSDELLRIAISFEELIFNTATDQIDYLRKISSKMQIQEE